MANGFIYDRSIPQIELIDGYDGTTRVIIDGSENTNSKVYVNAIAGNGLSPVTIDADFGAGVQNQVAVYANVFRSGPITASGAGIGCYLAQIEEHAADDVRSIIAGYLALEPRRSAPHATESVAAFAAFGDSASDNLWDSTLTMYGQDCIINATSMGSGSGPNFAVYTGQGYDGYGGGDAVFTMGYGDIAGGAGGSFIVFPGLGPTSGEHGSAIFWSVDEDQTPVRIRTTVPNFADLTRWENYDGYLLAAVTGDGHFQMTDGAVPGYVLTSDFDGVAYWAPSDGYDGYGYWTLDGNFLYPNFSDYDVVIGDTTTSIPGEKLRVNGDTTIDGRLRVGTATDAVGIGDFSSGMVGTTRLHYNQANESLNLYDNANQQVIQLQAFTPLSTLPYVAVGLGTLFLPGPINPVSPETVRIDSPLSGLRIEDNLGPAGSYIEFGDGQLAAPSQAIGPLGPEARLIYHAGFNSLAVSYAGAPYVPIGGGAPSGWTDDGVVVRLTTINDAVGIGTATPAAGMKLHVVGDTYLECDDFWVGTDGYARMTYSRLQESLTLFDSSDQATILLDAFTNGGYIGIGSTAVMGPSGSEQLNVDGDAYIGGKLTVIGEIDPVSVTIEDKVTFDSAFYEAYDGSNVSPVLLSESRGLLRYNNYTQDWEMSTPNTGGWVSFGGDGYAGYWDLKDGYILHPLDDDFDVTIGTDSVTGTGEKLYVYGRQVIRCDNLPSGSSEALYVEADIQESYQAVINASIRRMTPLDGYYFVTGITSRVNNLAADNIYSASVAFAAAEPDVENPQAVRVAYVVEGNQDTGNFYNVGLAAVDQDLEIGSVRRAPGDGFDVRISAGQGSFDGYGGTLHLSSGGGESTAPGGYDGADIEMYTGNGASTGPFAGAAGNLLIILGNASSDGFVPADGGSCNVELGSAAGIGGNPGRFTITGANGHFSGPMAIFQNQDGYSALEIGVEGWASVGGGFGLANRGDFAAGISGESSVIYFQTDGAMRWNDSGGLSTVTINGNTSFVGIGTDVPFGSESLSVLGDVRIDGEYLRFSKYSPSPKITIENYDLVGAANSLTIRSQIADRLNSIGGDLILGAGDALNLNGTGGDLTITPGRGSNTDGTLYLRDGQGQYGLLVRTSGAYSPNALVDFGAAEVTSSGNPIWNFGTSLATFGGNVQIDGKLTVDGALDPISVTVEDKVAGTGAYYEAYDGSLAGVVNPGDDFGRIRYNDSTGSFELSTPVSGGWVPMTGGGGGGGDGYWSLDGYTLYPDRFNYNVIIGDNLPSGYGEKLAVHGRQTIFGGAIDQAGYSALYVSAECDVIASSVIRAQMDRVNPAPPGQVVSGISSQPQTIVGDSGQSGTFAFFAETPQRYDLDAQCAAYVLFGDESSGDYYDAALLSVDQRMVLSTIRAGSPGDGPNIYLAPCDGYDGYGGDVILQGGSAFCTTTPYSAGGIQLQGGDARSITGSPFPPGSSIDGGGVLIELGEGAEGGSNGIFNVTTPRNTTDDFVIFRDGYDRPVFSVDPYLVDIHTNANVKNDLYVGGKLTVVGEIDPIAVIIESPLNDAYLEFGDGQSAVISTSNTGRIRYNDAEQKFQISINTGDYEDIVTTAYSVWTRDVAGFVYPTSVYDQVVIGGSDPPGTEQLRVSGGDFLMEGDIDFGVNTISPTLSQRQTSGIGTDLNIVAQRTVGDGYNAGSLWLVGGNAPTTGMGSSGGNVIVAPGDGDTEGAFYLRNAALDNMIIALDDNINFTVVGGGSGSVTATGNPTWNFGTSAATFGGDVFIDDQLGVGTITPDANSKVEIEYTQVTNGRSLLIDQTVGAVGVNYGVDVSYTRTNGATPGQMMSAYHTVLANDAADSGVWMAAFHADLPDKLPGNGMFGIVITGDEGATQNYDQALVTINQSCNISTAQFSAGSSYPIRLNTGYPSGDGSSGFLELESLDAVATAPGSAHEAGIIYLIVGDSAAGDGAAIAGSDIRMYTGAAASGIGGGAVDGGDVQLVTGPGDGYGYGGGVILSGTGHDEFFLQINDSRNAETSPGSTGRIIYDASIQRFMISQNGSVYAPIATDDGYLGSKWTRDGSVLYPNYPATDSVVIGGTSLVSDESLHVNGRQINVGGELLSDESALEVSGSIGQTSSSIISSKMERYAALNAGDFVCGISSDIRTLLADDPFAIRASFVASGVYGDYVPAITSAFLAKPGDISYGNVLTALDQHLTMNAVTRDPGDGYHVFIHAASAFENGDGGGVFINSGNADATSAGSYSGGPIRLAVGPSEALPGGEADGGEISIQTGSGVSDGGVSAYGGLFNIRLGSGSGAGYGGGVLISSLDGYDAYLQMESGENAQVSDIGTGRIIYNATTNRWEVSEDGGPYKPLVSGGSVGDGYWYRDPIGVLYPENVADNVAVNATSMYDTEVFRAAGDMAVGGDVIFESLVVGPSIYQDSISSGGAEALTISAQTTDDVAANGGDLDLFGGNGGATSGTGGSVNIASGTGNNDGAINFKSGSFDLLSFASDGGTQSRIIFDSGVSAANIYVAQEFGTANGCDLTISAQPGAISGGSGGDLRLISGQQTGGGISGDIELRCGLFPVARIYSNSTIAGFVAFDYSIGDCYILQEQSSSGDGSDFYISAQQSLSSGDHDGGKLSLSAGDGYGNGSGGNVLIQSGNGGANVFGYPGQIEFKAGSLDLAVLREYNLSPNSANFVFDSELSSGVVIFQDTAPVGMDGADFLVGAQDAGAGGSNGGDLILFSGLGNVADGAVQINAGNAPVFRVSRDNGTSLGQIEFDDNLSGVLISQQNPSVSGDGRDITIRAQSGIAGFDGGNIEILSGEAGAGGTDGDIILNAGSGEVYIPGKLTVDGYLDPSAVIIEDKATGDGAYFEMYNGTAVAAPDIGDNFARIRYNNISNQFESAVPGGSWQVLGGGSTGDGYWYRDPLGILYPENVADNVVIGAASMYDTEVFRVAGNTSAGGDIIFESSVTGPSIYQDSISSGNAETLTIRAQSTSDAAASGGDLDIYAGAATNITGGDGGNLILHSGNTAEPGTDNGSIDLYSGNTDHMVSFKIDGSYTLLEFHPDVMPVIVQEDADSGDGSDLVIVAQSAAEDGANSGGNIVIQTGDGYDGGSNGIIELNGNVEHSSADVVSGVAFGMSNTTSDANPVRLYLDEYDNDLVLEDDSAYTFDIIVTAINTGTGDVASWHFYYSAKRYGGITSEVNESDKTTISDESGGVWSCDLDVNQAVNNELDIVCVGDVGENIKWGATVKFTKIKM